MVNNIALIPAPIDWPGVKQKVMPYLESAMSEGADRDWTIDQVVKNIQLGAWGLYGVVANGDQIIGAGVVTTTAYGKRNVLEVILFGADVGAAQWKEVLDLLKREAAAFGCSAIQGRGRPGWARYLGATPINAFELEV